MKILFFTFLLLLFTCFASAQINLSYGINFGLNTSFIDSRATIDYTAFEELDRNMSLSTSAELGLGYQAGIFVQLKPTKSRFNLETKLQIVKYVNTYSFNYSHEDYFYTPWKTPVDNWIPEYNSRELQNEYTLLVLPVLLGFEMIQSDTYNLSAIAGAISNIKMGKNQTLSSQTLNGNSYYKTFFVSYSVGLAAKFEKLIFYITYNRSQDIMNAPSSDIFERYIKVDRININAIRIAVAYQLN